MNDAPVINKGIVQELNKQVRLEEKAAIFGAALGTKVPAKPIQQNNKIITQDDMMANLLSLPSLIEAKDDEFERTLCYGDSGMGKTLQMVMLSEFYNMLIIDADKGLKTALRTLPLELQKRIRVIKVPNNSSNPQFHNTVLKLITGRPVALCIEHGTPECLTCKKANIQLPVISLNQVPSDWIIGIDSITEFVASATFAINKRVTGGSDTKDDFKFTFDEWGELKAVMEKFGDYLKDLKCNSVCTSHTLLAETEDEKAKKLVPIGGSENSSRNFGKYFSTVVHCRIYNGKHSYVTTPTNNAAVTAKSRSNVKLEIEETPALLHIMRADAKELLKGSWTEWFFSKRDRPEPKPKNVLILEN